MSEAGKGDRYRPVDLERYGRNYDAIEWSDGGDQESTASSDRETGKQASDAGSNPAAST